MSTPVIAERQGVPRQYLEQILLLLKRAGYVRSRRGTGGGYRLARGPASISDGRGDPPPRRGPGPGGVAVSRYFYEPTPISRSPELLDVFRQIRDFVSDKLESTTFADLSGDRYQVARLGKVPCPAPRRRATGTPHGTHHHHRAHDRRRVLRG